MRMEFPLHCSLATDDGSRREAIDATASIGADSLRLVRNDDSDLVIDLRQVVCAETKDRAVRLVTCEGTEMLLDRLGGRQEELLRYIWTSKNDLLHSDLFGSEVPRIKGVNGELRTVTPAGAPLPLQKCELRVYRDFLTVSPERSDLVRVPFSRLEGAGVEKYSLVVRTKDGNQIAISKLGRDLEPARRAIAGAMADSRQRSVGILRDLVPSAEMAAIEALAMTTADGSFVSLADLESSVPCAAGAVDARLESAGIGERCRQLSSVGQSGMTRIAMRRRITRGEIKDDFWTLVPIASSEDGSMGNAIALQSTEDAPECRATLFFRIVPRASFSSSGGVLSENDVARALDEVGDALELSVFQRAPIVLSDLELTMPENARYRHAVSSIPGLSGLRHRFIGKVMHSSPEQWAETTRELLRFNVSAASDDEVFATA